MKTILNENYRKIVELFYKNKNKPLHLREISRQIKLTESPLSRHLNSLLKMKILSFSKEGNLKKFFIKSSQISSIFPFFDYERFENLPNIRKKAVKFYLKALKEKPILIVLFGSTASGNHREDSDIDLLVVFNRKTDNSKALSEAEAQTNIKLSEFKMTLEEYTSEIRLKDDYVVQSALESGFPIFNHQYYYEIKKDALDRFKEVF